MPAPRTLVVLAVAALSSAPAGVAAACEVASDVWRDAARPISIAADGVAGPGAAWIDARATASQFVLFGEAHGVTEIPRFVEAMLRQLRPHGFEHLAIEMGPWIAAQLSTRGVDATITQYPHGVAFDHDPELDLLRTAVNGFEGRGRAIWGLDQTSTAVHPFERLAEIAPNPIAARLARGASVKAALKFGEYLRQPHPGDLDALRAAFDPVAGDEADRLLDALAVSQEIFVAHREARYAESVATREQYMMQRLREELDTHRGDDPTRVIFKFGGAHIMEGVGPNGVRTLGDEAQRIASSNGLDALHIGFWRDRDEDAVPATIFDAGENAPPHRFVLVDAGALRAALDPGQRAALGDELRAAIEQYDAVVFIRDATFAPKNEIRTAKRGHRNARLAGLTPLAGVLGGLLAVLPLARRGWRRLRGRPTDPTGPLWPWLAMLAVTALLLGLLAWQMTAIVRGGGGTAALNAPDVIRIGVPLGQAAIIVGLAALVVVAGRRGGRGGGGRLGLIGVAALLLVGVAGMWWWNLGAMLP